jgi:hypothetical protein
MPYDDQIRAWRQQCDAFIGPVERFLGGQDETVRHFREMHEAALAPAREIQAAINRLVEVPDAMKTVEGILGPAFRVQALIPSSVAAIQEMSRLPDWHQSFLDAEERRRSEELERSREAFERSRELERSLQDSAALTSKRLARDIAEAIVERMERDKLEPETEEPEPKRPIGFGNRN